MYLSYQRDKNGAVTAVPSQTIDKYSKFQRDGNCYSLEGIALGYNVIVWGAEAPGGKLCFQRIPMFTPGWDANGPGDFGVIEQQADGTVAIRWPL